jgi:transcriptional regulator with XRE-family HTH domain
MKHGAELLKVWMGRMGLDQRQTAKEFGCCETHLSRLIRRRQRPGLAQSIKIERITGIPVESWLVTDKPKSSRAVHVTHDKCN